MKGFVFCLIVIVAVTTVRSQGPPTKTKKGQRPQRPNDNPDVGLPSGADIPDGRHTVPGAAQPPAGPATATGPASGNPVRGARDGAPAPGPRPGAPVPGPRPGAPVPGPSSGAPAPGPNGPGPKPPAPAPGPNPYPSKSSARSNTRGGRRNDNPDWGLPSGRDYPDSGITRTRSGPPPNTGRVIPRNNNGNGRNYYMPLAQPAPVQPVHSCDYYCQFEGYKPVCTVYGNEYDNDCYRACRNEPRECENQCPCNSSGPTYDAGPIVPSSPWVDPCNYCYQNEHSPVCVDSEETMYNECFANCQGKAPTCTSACPCT